jgi:hypothetical protein
MSGPEPGAAAPDPFINWAEFWSKDRAAPEWLLEDVLARGRGHLMYAPRKVGKSLFMLWCSADLAQRGVLVIYLDYEQGEDDVHERLSDMGYGADTDLSLLRYWLLPTLPPLDTPEGGRALFEHVDRAMAAFPGRGVLLVVDTISRAVAGEENDAGTAQGFYAHTGIGLKRREVTWVRLDHAGKDLERGVRGSSSKGDDVDVIWRLAETDDGVELRRDAARMSWVPERVALRKETDPILRYVPRPASWPAGTLDVSRLLDQYGVPLDASYRHAAEVLKANDEGRRQRVVLAALRYRRAGRGAGHTAGHTLPAGTGHVSGHNGQKPQGQAPDTPRDTPGHTGPGERDTSRVPIGDTVWPTPPSDAAKGNAGGAA